MIAAELAELDAFQKADVGYFRTLLNGAIENAAALEARIAPFLDRKFDELSPIERGILLLGGYELMRELEVPYRVVINEAVELAKMYGGTDGHKFVNGVLDKLAAGLREIEVSADRGAPRQPEGGLNREPADTGKTAQADAHVLLRSRHQSGDGGLRDVGWRRHGRARDAHDDRADLLAFAGLNFYMARVLRTQWDRRTRQAQTPPKPDGATTDG